jgi:hypothetical protein
MRNAKALLCATLFMAVLACAMLAVSVPTAAAAEPRTFAGNHWRHHDGRWNYWHDGDRRWYYTDGAHWFYNNGKAWNLYGFDKQFGREGFERGEYNPPGNRARIQTPLHSQPVRGQPVQAQPVRGQPVQGQPVRGNNR